MSLKLYTYSLYSSKIHQILMYNAYKIGVINSFRLNRACWKHRKFRCWLMFYQLPNASLIPDRPFRISYMVEIMIFRYIYGNLVTVILSVRSNVFVYFVCAEQCFSYTLHAGSFLGSLDYFAKLVYSLVM